MSSLRSWVDAVQRHRQRWLPELIILFSLSCILILSFQFSDLDLLFQSRFYDPQRGGWYLKELSWVKFINRYHARYLTISMALISISCISLSFLKPASFSRSRPYASFALIALLVGPGLMVNVLLKPHWGRPRPRQVFEFNGNREYRQALTLKSPRRGRSFPSGHAATAFATCMLFHLFRERKKWAYAGLAFGLIQGSLAGFARIANGAHFLTDVLWAGILIFALNGFLYYCVWNLPEKIRQPQSVSPPYWTFAISWLLFLSLILGAAAATPIYHDHDRVEYLHDDRLELLEGLKLELEVAELRLIREDRVDVSIRYTAHGFGFHGSSMERRTRVREFGENSWLHIYSRLKGHIHEFTAIMEIRVPDREDFALDIEIENGSLILESSAPAPKQFRVHLEEGHTQFPDHWPESSVPRNI